MTIMSICQGEIPEGVMDTYCWIHSTFTLPKLVSEEVGVVIPHPGVGPVPDLNYEEEIVRHTFYQWVCFVLFLQVRLSYCKVIISNF